MLVGELSGLLLSTDDQQVPSLPFSSLSHLPLQTIILLLGCYGYQFIDYIKLLELLICIEFSAIKLAAFSQN